MEKQRTRARASWKGADKAQIAPVYHDLPPTEFIGRETLEAPVKVLRIIKAGETVRKDDGAGDGILELVFDRTPFYAEAGGQVGDTGVLRFAFHRRHRRDGRGHRTSGARGHRSQDRYAR